jgi:tRNA A37 threonylcarbamoyladenosine dehydratase
LQLKERVKIISAGAGGKMEAAKVKVADITNTENCSSKTIRRRLKA